LPVRQGAIRRLLTGNMPDRGRIRAPGRRAGSVPRVHRALRLKPLASIPRLMGGAGLTAPTVTSGLAVLEK
jgi:hypothetical protein